MKTIVSGSATSHDGDRRGHARVDVAEVVERTAAAEAPLERLAGRQRSGVPHVGRGRVVDRTAVLPPDHGSSVDREAPRTEPEVDDPNALYRRRTRHRLERLSWRRRRDQRDAEGEVSKERTSHWPPDRCGPFLPCRGSSPRSSRITPGTRPPSIRGRRA